MSDLINARDADEFDGIMDEEDVAVCRGSVVHEWLDKFNGEHFEEMQVFKVRGFGDENTPSRLDPKQVYVCDWSKYGGLFIYKGGDEATVRAAVMNAGGWMARPADFIADEVREEATA